LIAPTRGRAGRRAAPDEACATGETCPPERSHRARPLLLGASYHGTTRRSPGGNPRTAPPSPIAIDGISRGFVRRRTWEVVDPTPAALRRPRRRRPGCGVGAREMAEGGTLNVRVEDVCPVGISRSCDVETYIGPIRQKTATRSAQRYGGPKPSARSVRDLERTPLRRSRRVASSCTRRMGRPRPLPDRPAAPRFESIGACSSFTERGRSAAPGGPVGAAKRIAQGSTSSARGLPLIQRRVDPEPMTSRRHVSC